MKDILYHVLPSRDYIMVTLCVQRQEVTKHIACGHVKACTAISMYASDALCSHNHVKVQTEKEQ